jgi:hypothetical protein
MHQNYLVADAGSFANDSVYASSAPALRWPRNHRMLLEMSCELRDRCGTARQPDFESIFQGEEYSPLWTASLNKILEHFEAKNAA